MLENARSTKIGPDRFSVLQLRRTTGSVPVQD